MSLVRFLVGTLFLFAFYLNCSSVVFALNLNNLYVNKVRIICEVNHTVRVSRTCCAPSSSMKEKEEAARNKATLWQNRRIPKLQLKCCHCSGKPLFTYKVKYHPFMFRLFRKVIPKIHPQRNSRIVRTVKFRGVKHRFHFLYSTGLCCHNGKEGVKIFVEEITREGYQGLRAIQLVPVKGRGSEQTITKAVLYYRFMKKSKPITLRTPTREKGSTGRLFFKAPSCKHRSVVGWKQSARQSRKCKSSYASGIQKELRSEFCALQSYMCQTRKSTSIVYCDKGSSKRVRTFSSGHKLICYWRESNWVRIGFTKKNSDIPHYGWMDARVLQWPNGKPLCVFHGRSDKRKNQNCDNNNQRGNPSRKLKRKCPVRR